MSIEKVIEQLLIIEPDLKDGLGEDGMVSLKLDYEALKQLRWLLTRVGTLEKTVRGMQSGNGNGSGDGGGYNPPEGSITDLVKLISEGLYVKRLRRESDLEPALETPLKMVTKDSYPGVLAIWVQTFQPRSSSYAKRITASKDLLESFDFASAGVYGDWFKTFVETHSRLRASISSIRGALDTAKPFLPG